MFVCVKNNFQNFKYIHRSVLDLCDVTLPWLLFLFKRDYFSLVSRLWRFYIAVTNMLTYELSVL